MGSLAFNVARVKIVINKADGSSPPHFPKIYQKFVPPTPDRTDVTTNVDSITFVIRLESHWPSKFDFNVLSHEPSWQLGKDQQGNFIIWIEKPLPKRFLVMRPDFSSGILYTKAIIEEEAKFPLNSLDIIVFSNWLANQGDLLLHAGGVSINGQGYAFVGHSGAGKSTIVANLAKDSRVTVLGEDQVALRYLDGAYWIFGTPWHLNPERCSPIGVPLKEIFFLDRQAADILTPLSPQVGFKQLMQTAFIPYYRPPQVSLIMENLERLSFELPFKLLAYRLGDDIIKIVLDG